MKAVIILLLAVAAAVAIPLERQQHQQSGDDGWYVPQTDGSLEWVTFPEAKKMEQQVIKGRAGTMVFFYLYTKKNPTEPDNVISGNVKSLAKSHFNNNNPTRFIIHGWLVNGSSKMNYDIRDAYLSQGDYNIITVDWSDKSQSLNYAASKLRVPGVGVQVANFIDFLYKKAGLSFKTLQLIGHSLGAHIAGYAGKNVVNGQINQITGLDPALPLFSYDSPSTRLNQNDAFYVESIHTCGGLLGFQQPIGKSAFYPNGGKSQPGCGLDVVGSCAHERSWVYFAEAIAQNNYPSVKCGNWELAVEKSCGKTYSAVRMASAGNFVSANGHFYVPVNKKAPYGKGS